MSTLAAVLVVVIFAAPMMSTNITALYPVVADAGNTQQVGMVLFTKYLIPFELAAVMLLVAMIGGIVLAGKKMDLSLSTMTEVEIEAINRATETKKKVFL
jgi:NADH-quinone oxidoreductase subunit J